MWLLKLLLCCFFASSIASPLIEPRYKLRQKKNGPRLADPSYRLNSDVIPHYYFIKIIPYFDTGDDLAFTFDSEVVILIRNEKENNKQIVLHASGLNITAENVNVIDFVGTALEKDSERPIEFDSKRELLKINLAQGLRNETGYLIAIFYNGTIGDGRSGFYRTSYMENGKTKWAGATQFQPTYARKVFPCFDEPQFKSIFILTIVRPNEFKRSLSNMPINSTEVLGDRTVEVFNPTPSMSTYLLAFVISEFSNTEGDEETAPGDIEVWSRPEAIQYGNYSKESASNIIKAMSNLTGVEYFDVDEFMKMDSVALPDSTGAMENWGLVTYGEITLLYGEETSSAIDQLLVYITVAHEIAHMWFGNLVTCEWWSDTWLNEGFATYFEFNAAHQADPSLEMDIEFVVDAVQLALVADGYKNSAPLSDPNVSTPEDISNHFGTITYKKGGSVIRMMEHILGKSTFLKGLNHYLSVRRYQNSKPSDLYEALQTVADADGSLKNYASDITVAKVMGSWVSQAGYPLVTVSSSNNTIFLTQERFYWNRNTVSQEVYEIPITVTSTNIQDFENTKPLFIFNTKTTLFQYTHSASDWILLNTQQTGLYRVNYDDRLWAQIILTLNGKSSIHQLNKAQIVDDLFAFADSERIGYVTLFERILFLTYETDYAPWEPALENFIILRRAFLVSEKDLKLFDRFVLELMETMINSFGLSEGLNDTNLQRRFRIKALRMACWLGHRECIDAAIYLYDQQKIDNKTMSPDARSWVYCAALKNGTGSDFDFLLDLYYEEKMQHAELNILEALGCTSNIEKINLFLSKSIDGGSDKRQRYNARMFLSVIFGNDDNVEAALTFLENNFKQMRKMYGSINASIANLAYMMYTDEQLDKLEEFLQRNASELKDELENALDAVDDARNEIDEAEVIRKQLVPWLESKYV